MIFVIKNLWKLGVILIVISIALGEFFAPIMFGLAIYWFYRLTTSKVIMDELWGSGGWFEILNYIVFAFLFILHLIAGNFLFALAIIYYALGFYANNNFYKFCTILEKIEIYWHKKNKNGSYR